MCYSVKNMHELGMCYSVKNMQPLNLTTAGGGVVKMPVPVVKGYGASCSGVRSATSRCSGK